MSESSKARRTVFGHARMTNYEGYETWQAVHQGCGPDEPCCVVLDVDVTPKIRQAAKVLGMSPDAFVHMALVEALG